MAENAPDAVPKRIEPADTYVERTAEPAGLTTPNAAGNDGRLAYARRVAAEMDRRVEVLVNEASVSPLRGPENPRRSPRP